MSDLGRVVVLAGGLSHERDVSIRSGRRVADALRSAGVEVQVRDSDGQFKTARTGASGIEVEDAFVDVGHRLMRVAVDHHRDAGRLGLQVESSD